MLRVGSSYSTVPKSISCAAPSLRPRFARRSAHSRTITSSGFWTLRGGLSILPAIGCRLFRVKSSARCIKKLRFSTDCAPVTRASSMSTKREVKMAWFRSIFSRGPATIDEGVARFDDCPWTEEDLVAWLNRQEEALQSEMWSAISHDLAAGHSRQTIL